MSLQFISNSEGETTGVFIPISEWNELKSKYKGIEAEELNLPNWQVDIVRERKKQYLANPSQALDFYAAMDEIEKNL